MILAIVVLLLAALAAATAIGAWQVSRSFPPVGRFVEVEGGRLHVLERGPAAPDATVVLLHGAAGNLRDIDLALGRRLAESHRVIAIDRPGHGWSDRPGGAADASPARQAALIAQALDAMGVGEAVMVGHSWAGALATNLALDHAEKVSGLVLIAPATHPWPGGTTWYYPVAAFPVLGELFMRTVMLPAGWFMVEAGVKGVFSPHEPPDDYARQTGAPLLLRPREFRANAADVHRLKRFVTAQAPRYAEIDVPTSIVTADADHVVSPTIHSRALAREIAGARLVVVAGAGHMPHHTATGTVIAEIERVAAAARARAAVVVR